MQVYTANLHVYLCIHVICWNDFWLICVNSQEMQIQCKRAKKKKTLFLMMIIVVFFFLHVISYMYTHNHHWSEIRCVRVCVCDDNQICHDDKKKTRFMNKSKSPFLFVYSLYNYRIRMHYRLNDSNECVEIIYIHYVRRPSMESFTTAPSIEWVKECVLRLLSECSKDTNSGRYFE